MKAFTLATLCFATSTVRAGAPDFGPNVLIFDPATKDVQKQVDAVFAKQEKSQFGSDRYALLFKPGRYAADVQVGFYTQVSGLGQKPDDVDLTGAVRSTAAWFHGNATCNFWRSAENLAVRPTRLSEPNVWAVSQGAGLRRMHFRGNLHLWDGGWSSGGYLADSKIDGRVVSGSQQQWFSRNDDWQQWDGGVWNMVFVGVNKPPAGAWPQQSYSIVPKTPVIREKPFLTIDKDGTYAVRVPALNTGGTHGTSWLGLNADAAESISIDKFYVAHPDHDDSKSINAALAAGQNLLLTPGIYHLNESLRVTRAKTIVLGLGFATLIPDAGTPAITVADVDGVTIAGLILDAGKSESPALLQVGEPGAVRTSHAKDPIFLYDLVCRAGGATAGTTNTFLTIDANNIVGDNLWLWRADHGEGAGWATNRVRNGLVVNGDDVTMYGLFVEHTQEYQTLWNGNGGHVYFYQSEMPYDPPSQTAWSHDGVKGFASYKVADTVTTHEAIGLGVYCVFNDAPIIANAAVETPAAASGVKMKHLVSIRLAGQPGSGIEHILNGRGDPVISTMKAQLE